jgi:hypothetical protein
MSRAETIPVPAVSRWGLRLALVAIVAAYFFISYCILRSLLAEYGLAVSTIAKASIATAAMATFIVWAVPLADLAEIVHRHLLPQRRASQGRCAACGYDLREGSVRCPECGFDGPTPGPWHLAWSSAQRFSIMLLVGLLVGCVAGEAWIASDERRFAEEAAAFGAAEAARIAARASADDPEAYRRPRAWPAQFALLQADESGSIVALDPFHSPRIEGWKPRSAPERRNSP